jgi:hypothetical protein
MRRDVDESFSPEGIKTLAHDIRPGKVYEKNGVTVTAFRATHRQHHSGRGAGCRL